MPIATNATIHTQHCLSGQSLVSLTWHLVLRHAECKNLSSMQVSPDSKGRSVRMAVDGKFRGVPEKAMCVLCR